MNAQLRVALFLTSGLFVSSPVASEPVAEFYHGKTVNLLIGSGVGGGYDTYGRALGQFIGRHIPGNPTVVVQNVLGGGGIKMLSSLYNIASKDGTVIGTATPIAVLKPLFGDKSVAPYDPLKFTWLGNMDQDSSACVASRLSNITDFSDAFKRQVTFGASTKDTVFYQQALVLKELLGANIRIINGYIAGMMEINLAMQRGEVDAVCSVYESTAKADLANDIAKGALKFIIQFGETNSPMFGSAVNVHDLLKTDEQKELAHLILSQSEMTRPFMAPPGLPPDIAKALKQAFMDTLTDPEFLDYADKTKIAIKPVSGDDLAVQIDSFFKLPPAILDRARALISTD